MPATITLFEFLEKAGARVSVYDVGRRIAAIGRAQFLAFERAERPYPTPMQRKAWFALVQTSGARPDDPVIWFLRLDLDEQGLLVQAARDYLLNRLLESAQAQSSGADPSGFLRDNPYAFSPREDRMAQFHALLSSDLGLAPSRFYDHALEYFRGEPGWEQWKFVGYQGIADVACRHRDAPLTTAIAKLPNEPLIALGHCLEGRRLDSALRGALIARLARALTDEPVDTAVTAALIRALSSSTAEDDVSGALRAVLAHPAATDIEWLAAISGRAWESLNDPALLDAYLERLAANDHGQAAFERCISDLLSLPDMAPRVRARLRAPDISAPVRQAFARLARQGDG